MRSRSASTKVFWAKRSRARNRPVVSWLTPSTTVCAWLWAMARSRLPWFASGMIFGDIGQDLLAAFGARVGRAAGGGAVAQLRDGTADEIRDDVNANHILLTAIQDVAEIIGQFRQETLVERLRCVPTVRRSSSWTLRLCALRRLSAMLSAARIRSARCSRCDSRT